MIVRPSARHDKTCRSGMVAACLRRLKLAWASNKLFWTSMATFNVPDWMQKPNPCAMPWVRLVRSGLRFESACLTRQAAPGINFLRMWG
jgi:hypothetical protein